MGLLDNGLRGNILTGLAIGVGVSVLGPVVLPIIVGAAKPFVKAAIKGGIVLYDRSKESFAEVGEVVEDLVAEVKAELAETSGISEPPQA